MVGAQNESIVGLLAGTVFSVFLRRVLQNRQGVQTDTRDPTDAVRVTSTVLLFALAASVVVPSSPSCFSSIIACSMAFGYLAADVFDESYFAAPNSERHAYLRTRLHSLCTPAYMERLSVLAVDFMLSSVALDAFHKKAQTCVDAFGRAAFLQGVVMFTVGDSITDNMRTPDTEKKLAHTFPETPQELARVLRAIQTWPPETDIDYIDGLIEELSDEESTWVDVFGYGRADVIRYGIEVYDLTTQRALNDAIRAEVQKMNRIQKNGSPRHAIDRTIMFAAVVVGSVLLSNVAVFDGKGIYDAHRKRAFVTIVAIVAIVMRFDTPRTTSMCGAHVAMIMAIGLIAATFASGHLRHRNDLAYLVASIVIGGLAVATQTNTISHLNILILSLVAIGAGYTLINKQGATSPRIVSSQASMPEHDDIILAMPPPTPPPLVSDDHMCTSPPFVTSEDSSPPSTVPAVVYHLRDDTIVARPMSADDDDDDEDEDDHLSIRSVTTDDDTSTIKSHDDNQMFTHNIIFLDDNDKQAALSRKKVSFDLPPKAPIPDAIDASTDLPKEATTTIESSMPSADVTPVRSPAVTAMPLPVFDIDAEDVSDLRNDTTSDMETLTQSIDDDEDGEDGASTASLSTTSTSTEEEDSLATEPTAWYTPDKPTLPPSDTTAVGRDTAVLPFDDPPARPTL